MSSTIVGFFDDRAQAEKARTDLKSLGLPESDIQILSGDMDQEATATNKGMSEDLSWTERIKRFFTDLGDWNSSDDVHYYAEGVRRGGATVSATVDDAKVDEASDILNRDGAVDINQRGQFFKETGFSQYDFNSKPLSRDESMSSRDQFSEWQKNRASSQDKDQVIPVIQENVNIGKQAIEKGRVHVYTRVRETPIDQQVNLRDERVEVQRTPVDRPVQTGDMSAFKEGEIEMKETTEEPVINKEARVVEEVRLQKKSEERTENIHETARRTEVEVDRAPKSRSRDKNPSNR